MILVGNTKTKELLKKLFRFVSYCDFSVFFKQ